MSLAEAGSVSPPASHGVSFREAFWTWLRVALLSFGGPAGQIAVMHRIVVEEKKWIGETRFLHALNYCMLLPGPEAQQLAVYIGWLMHRTAGGLVAGILFVLPGMVSIMVLSWLYAGFGAIGTVQALFFGLKAAVLAIVLEAVIRIGKRSLKNATMVGFAAASFLAIFVLGISFPWIILGAGLIGFIGHRVGIAAFQPGGGHGSSGGKQALSDADSRLGEGTPAHTRPSTGWLITVLAISFILWFGPIIVIFATLGGSSVFADISVFFSKMAVVTFGGAYAVLAYVAQEAVQHYGWVRPGEMLDGLGMAETTPGPLIMVLQFVGFMAAFRDPGSLSPMVAGTLGGLLTTWVTFVPCFLFIFAGAPYIEALRGNKALGAALSSITAAVVGVVLNLAIWFALHTWFHAVTPIPGLALEVPVPSSLDPWALALSVAAMVAIFRFHVGMIPTLAASSGAGIVLYLLGIAP
ncbi:MAG TPA: chromate efflux transporter [Alphaproteobacteria bacterium]